MTIEINFSQVDFFLLFFAPLTNSFEWFRPAEVFLTVG